MTPLVRRLVAGNWKMNGLRQGGVALARAIADHNRQLAPRCGIVICPPATLLALVSEAIGGASVGLGGQDCHAEEFGAFTGDVSATMLRDIGCEYVIVGHSERRGDHQETSAVVRAKAKAAISAGLVPIICVGESDEQREAGHALGFVTQQVRESVPSDEFAEAVVVAYEPIWAIGTGKSAHPADVEEMHRAIRQTLATLVPSAEIIRILYGGSVKPDNAAEIFATPGVDGALVGGASLDASAFQTIIDAAVGAA